jgi:hypothetical protein
VIAVLDVQGFTLWRGLGRIYRGLARVNADEGADALTEVAEGVALTAGTGAVGGAPASLLALADGQRAAGRPADALGAVKGGLADELPSWSHLSLFPVPIPSRTEVGPQSGRRPFIGTAPRALSTRGVDRTAGSYVTVNNPSAVLWLCVVRRAVPLAGMVAAIDALATIHHQPAARSSRARRTATVCSRRPRRRPTCWAARRL